MPECGCLATAGLMTLVRSGAVEAAPGAPAEVDSELDAPSSAALASSAALREPIHGDHDPLIGRFEVPRSEPRVARSALRRLQRFMASNGTGR